MQARSKKAQIINQLLIREYGEPRWTPRLDPLSELILTILSQHTSDINSKRAFDNLRATFPTWEDVREAPEASIANAIRSAGLANIKARRIKETLESIAARGNFDLKLNLNLKALETMSLPEAKAWLQSLRGVGPKTAACVLLFSLGRPAMPVDTHVHRVSRRLGLIDEKTTADAAHGLLEEALPPADVYAFHINMVNHGRRVCIARGPRCGICVLQPECAFYQSTIADTE